MSPREDSPSMLARDLRAGIQRNQRIPAFFQDIKNHFKAHKKRLDQIKLAIVAGDFSIPLLNQPNDSLYLLYLIETESVDFWQGITMYLYLMALMEFTEHQPFSEADAKLGCFKTNCPVSLLPLWKDNQLTEVGEGYLNLLDENYRIMRDKAFPRDHFLAQLKTLSRVDQSVLMVEFTVTRALMNVVVPVEASLIEAERFRFLRSLSLNVPFLDMGLLPEQAETGVVKFFIPSLRLIEYFLMLESDTPVNLLLRFGRYQSLHAMHQRNEHLLPLYSPFVRDNYFSVHDFQCGPFACFVHDVLHAYHMNLLSNEERLVIYECLLPKFRSLLENKPFDVLKQERLKKIIFDLNDMDIAPLAKFKGEDLFCIYIKRCIQRNEIHPDAYGFYAHEYRVKTAPLGGVFDDYLLFEFLSACHAYALKNPCAAPVISRLITEVLSSISARPRLVLDAIQALAAGNDFDASVVVHLRFPAKLLELFKSDLAVPDLYEALSGNESLYADLLTLIIKGSLSFMAPYVRLSTDDRNAVVRALTVHCHQRAMTFHPLGNHPSTLFSAPLDEDTEPLFPLECCSFFG